MGVFSLPKSLTNHYAKMDILCRFATLVLFMTSTQRHRHMQAQTHIHISAWLLQLIIRRNNTCAASGLILTVRKLHVLCLIVIYTWRVCLLLTILQVKTPDVSGGSVLYPSQMVPLGPGKESGARRKRKQSASEVCFVMFLFVSGSLLLQVWAMHHIINLFLSLFLYFKHLFYVNWSSVSW